LQVHPDPAPAFGLALQRLCIAKHSTWARLCRQSSHNCPRAPSIVRVNHLTLPCYSLVYLLRCLLMQRTCILWNLHSFNWQYGVPHVPYVLVSCVGCSGGGASKVEGTSLMDGYRNIGTFKLRGQSAQQLEYCTGWAGCVLLYFFWIPNIESLVRYCCYL
jgi:hypothetical protein